MAGSTRTTNRAQLKSLVAWIGRQDLDGAASDPPTGPIIDFMRVHPGVNAVLLSDWPKDVVAQYLGRVQRHAKVEIDVRPVKLKDPTDYLGIYRAADATLENLAKRYRTDEIAIHTSPGTSAMAAVWILLAKTKYAGAQLFKSWLDKSGQPQLASGGVKERAAKLVGVASRQALSHRMRRLGIGSSGLARRLLLGG